MTDIQDTLELRLSEAGRDDLVRSLRHLPTDYDRETLQLLCRWAANEIEAAVAWNTRALRSSPGPADEGLREKVAAKIAQAITLVLGGPGQRKTVSPHNTGCLYFADEILALIAEGGGHG